MTEHKYNTLVEMYKNNEISIEELLSQGFSQEFALSSAGTVAVETDYDFEFFNALISNKVITLKDCLNLHDEEKILRVLSNKTLVKSASVEDFDDLLLNALRSNVSVTSVLSTHFEFFDCLFHKKFNDDVKSFVDFIKEHKLLNNLFSQTEFCKTFLSHSKNVAYLLTHIENSYDLMNFLKNNIQFLHESLKHQLLSKSHIDRFQKIFEDTTTDLGRNLQRSQMFDVFMFLENNSKERRQESGYQKTFKKSLEFKEYKKETKRLLENLKNVYFLPFGNEQQKYELLKLLNSSKFASEQLQYIADNHLIEESYKSFDELLSHLKRTDKKTTLNA